MTCKEALDRLPALALGELDKEWRKEVESHLLDCAACRDAQKAVAETLGALTAEKPVEPSVERRGRAVAAMRKAYDGHVMALISRPRSRWVSRTAAAAAVMLAFVGGLMMAPPSTQATSDAPVVLEIVGAEGLARVYLSRKSAWFKAEKGVALMQFDRLVTEAGGRVVAELRQGRASVGRLHLHQNTSVIAVGPSSLALESGEMFVEASRPTTVAGVSGELLRADAAAYEARIVDAPTSIMPRPAEVEREWVDRPLKEVAEEVGNLTNKKMRVSGLWPVRITVYVAKGGDVLDAFRSALERHGLALSGDVIEARTAGIRGFGSWRLRASFRSGKGVLAGEGGTVNVGASQTASLDRAGYPAVDAAGAIAAWLDGPTSESTLDFRPLSVRVQRRESRLDFRAPPVDGVVRTDRGVVWMRLDEWSIDGVEFGQGEREVIVPMKVRIGSE